MLQIFVVLLVLLQIFAIYYAWRAITSARTSQGSIGWVVFLLTAPYIAVPLYLFLGHTKIRGYEISRRQSERVVSAVKDFAARNAPATAPEVNPAPFERIADLPAVRGNDMELLIDGAATFDAIFAAIDDAQDYVLVRFYIVRDDGMGRALRDRMIAAAKRGVHVRFFVDAVGSHSLPATYYEALRDGGVDVIDPNRARGPKTRFQLNFRNHRKTVIADGVTAFIGGFNVGEEYMGRDPKFGNWRDTHVLLRGPVVSQLQLVYAEDWHWGTGEMILDDLKWQAPHAEANRTALIVPTGPGDGLETGALFFFSAIAAANERVWIASPYCVPDTDILSALKHAALSGVETRLLVPEVIDHRIPWLAAFAYFDELREAGVEIWRYDDGFMHQKVVLVDQSFAAVGTSNLDNRSFRLNFETMAVFFDADVASQVERMLSQDFTKAFRLERVLAEQPAAIRYGAPVARLFSPIL